MLQQAGVPAYLAVRIAFCRTAAVPVLAGPLPDRVAIVVPTDLFVLLANDRGNQAGKYAHRLQMYWLPGRLSGSCQVTVQCDGPSGHGSVSLTDPRLSTGATRGRGTLRHRTLDRMAAPGAMSHGRGAMVG